MIEKMKFLSITGPKDDIDRVADVYLSKYEMHLENALSELNTVKDLRPFIDVNPYKNIYSKTDDIVKHIPSSASPSYKELTSDEAISIINDANKILSDYYKEKDELTSKKKFFTDTLQKLEPFRMLSFSLSDIRNFKFIKFRYGKMPHDSFDKFVKYEYSDLNVIFFESDNDENYIWGLYFSPVSEIDKLDAIFSSLHFERTTFLNDYQGKPDDAYRHYYSELQLTTAKLERLKKSFKDKLNSKAEDILSARNFLAHASQNCSLRKLAACTRDTQVLPNDQDPHEHMVFYILCGWMDSKDADKFLKELDSDPNIFCFSDNSQDTFSKPPTKLKNPKIFKPFEMFINMYGLPAYNEIDPTIFVALTYSFLFGMMFGDVGQGLLLTILGLLLYKYKNMNLAAIIALAGIFSTAFGFMYGSVFGFEGKWIEPVWTSPMNNVMTVLFTAVAIGVGLNLLAMILNIINGIKSNDKGRILFDTNGIAGFVFYSIIICCVVLFFKGYSLPATWILVICLAIPIICIFLREPLGRLVERKKTLINGGKGMFFVEAFFELFEIMLSFMTNSLSFVRVGAFALSHAGMMGVVLMLSNAEGSLTSLSVGNIIVLVLGNLFVMGLEGLSVGIQVLRLEYYELFSRFYGGTGKKFVPFINKEI